MIIKEILRMLNRHKACIMAEVERPDPDPNEVRFFLDRQRSDIMDFLKKDPVQEKIRMMESGEGWDCE